MNIEQVNIFLEDLTYNCDYEFLEVAKHKKELEEITKKHGIVLPSNDLSPFKCIYAYVDRMNKNGCTLPRDEVKKALSTLVGKAIDFDHLRQKPVGYWLDAKLEGDKIIAYGVFFKSNLKDDYAIIKDLMSKGNLKVSFEAYGIRQYTSPTTYNLKDIEFAGGALLITTQPAFEGAEVLELAKERVLELASVMTPPKTYLKAVDGDEPFAPAKLIKRVVEEKIVSTHYYDTKPEKFEREGYRVTTNYYSDGKKSVFTEKVNVNEIYRAMVDLSIDDLIIILEESALPKAVTNCVRQKIKQGIKPIDAVKQCWLEYKKDNPQKSNINDSKMKLEDIKKLLEETSEESIVDKIFDFEGSDEELEMFLANEIEGEDLIDDDGTKIEEAKRLTYKERQALPDDMFAVVVKKGDRKIRMFPIQDPAHVRNALSRLGQAKPQATLKKLGVSIESVRKKILRRAKELNMTQLLERYKNKGAENMEEKIKEFEETIAQLKEEIQKKDAVIDELKKESEEAKAKIEEIEKTKSAEIEKAKEEARIVAERRAELGDFAKDASDEDLLNDLKFDNLKLKKEIAELKAKKAEKGNLEAGSSGNDGDKDNDKEIFEKQKRIQTKAWSIAG